MKKLTTIFSLILFVAVSAQAAFAQQPNKPTDLLAGEVKEKGLHEGWDTAYGNFDCTIKFGKPQGDLF